MSFPLRVMLILSLVLIIGSIILGLWQFYRWRYADRANDIIVYNQLTLS